MPETIVVALGGNALQKPGLPPDAENQLRVVRDTAKQLIEIIKDGKRLAIVHGNGPQVGRIVLQNEAASALTPAMPFDVCGAMSQGMIGYYIQQALGDELSKAGFTNRPVTLVSQVEVDPADPAFSHPTKPIGPFYTQTEAELLMKDKGFVFKEDAGRGWRRVVASPLPLALVELHHVMCLMDNGFIPIAAGGGGIPVIRTGEGGLEGIAAVIDKDLAAWRLAEGLKADTLLILTEVENASLNYGKKEQSPIRRIHAPQLRAWLEEGHFSPGSMGPKVDAALRFVEGNPGRRVIITRLDLALDGLKGTRGTEIIA